MDVFGYGTEEGSRPLLPPGTCWICENSPQQEAMKVIDTRRNSRAGGVSKGVSERKYVCQPCAEEMGAAMGMVGEDVFRQQRDDLVREEQRSMDLSAELTEARASQTRVVSVKSVLDDLPETFAAVVRAELAKLDKPGNVAAKPKPSVPPAQ